MTFLNKAAVILAAISANLGEVDISDANIGTLQVDTANIKNLAVNGAKIDVDAITTAKVANNTIEKHLSFSVNEPGTAGWDDTAGDHHDTHNLGNSGGIVNSNPSAVMVGISYSILATVTAKKSGVNDPDVTSDATTTIRLYSEKTDGTNSSVIYSASVSVSDSTASGGGDSRFKGDTIFVVDVYGSSDNRRYRVEVTYDLNVGGGTATSEHDASADISLIWWQK